MGSLQRCFAVKPEINGLLDVARRTYSELIEDIQKIVENLSESYDLPLKLNQNMLKGFHIVLPVAPKNRRNFCIEDLPPVFIQVGYSQSAVRLQEGIVFRKMPDNFTRRIIDDLNYLILSRFILVEPAYQ